MKYLKLLIVFLLVAFSSQKVSAQDNASDAASVSADVVSSIGVTANQNLLFGQIVSTSSGGETITIAKDGSGNQSSQAGKFTVNGTAGATVLIETSNQSNTNSTPDKLDDGSGNSLDITYNLYSNGTDNASGSSSFTSGNDVTLNGSGNFYFYLGGEITTGTSQATGTYEGQYTLTATYN